MVLSAAPLTRPITKTRFLLGRQCSRRQWLGHRGEVEPEVTEPALLALQVEAGREVEELAAQLFPGAVLVHREGEPGLGAEFGGDAYIGVEGTARALEAEVAVLQAHFTAEGLAAISDIVEVRADGLFLWEVKSSTNKPEGKSDGDAKVRALYDWDLAYQIHVAREAGHCVVGGGLILLNAEYVRGEGAVEARDALVQVDRSVELEALAGAVATEVGRQLAMLDEAAMPKELPGPRCKESRDSRDGNRPSTCGHLGANGICGRDLPVFWAGGLPKLQGKKIALVTGTAGVKIEDLDAEDSEADWTPAQRRVIEAVQTRDEVVDRAALQAELDALEWPVAYVDFEFDPTMAIPRHAGMRPYDRVPFQWALGVEREKGGGLGEVQSFLAMTDADPSREFAESLLAALPPSGSIVAHHQSAETTVLEQIARRLGGEVGERLLELIPRFADTEKIASAGYYHPDQMSSYSIKKLAPALTGRGYDGLAIANGMRAVTEWRRAIGEGIDADERETIRRHLLEYCGLDAELMHDILVCLKARSRVC